MNKRPLYRIFRGATLPPPVEYEEGDLFIEQSSLTIYLRDGGAWVPVATAGFVTDATNIGVGTGEVFESKAGTILRFRTLLNTDGALSIQTVGDEVRIDLETSGPNAPVTDAQNVGGAYEVFRDKTGNTLNFRTIEDASVSGYSIIDGYGTDTIRFRGIGDTGWGESLIAGTSVSDIELKGLESSSGSVIITDTGDTLDLDVDAASIGAVTDGQNVGSPPGWSPVGNVFRDKTGTTLNFKRLAMIGAEPPVGRLILYGDHPSDTIRFRSLVPRGDVHMGYGSDESLIVGSEALHLIHSRALLIYSGYDSWNSTIWVDNSFSTTFPAEWDDYPYLLFTAIIFNADLNKTNQINHVHIGIRYNGVNARRKFLFGFGAAVGNHDYDTGDPAVAAAGSAIVGRSVFRSVTGAPSGSSWDATIYISMNGYASSASLFAIGFIMWGLNERH